MKLCEDAGSAAHLMNRRPAAQGIVGACVADVTFAHDCEQDYQHDCERDCEKDYEYDCERDREKDYGRDFEYDFEHDFEHDKAALTEHC
ncbi:hypothetical protein ACWCPI_36840 [Streptomyces sp. NPDC001920]